MTPMNLANDPGPPICCGWVLVLSSHKDKIHAFAINLGGPFLDKSSALLVLIAFGRMSNFILCMRKISALHASISWQQTLLPQIAISICSIRTDGLNLIKYITIRETHEIHLRLVLHSHGMAQRASLLFD